jgi:protein-tyrosine phosphatase
VIEPRLTDLHSHVLAGIDDGPDSIDESLALLESLIADDVRVVYATPHVQPEPYRTRVAARDGALAPLRAAAADAGLAITIEPGAELDLEYAATWPDQQLRAFTLGHGSALLIEFPWGGGWPLALVATCARLRERGFLPVIAHPERASVVQQKPDRMRDVVKAGGIGQITAASLSGRLGHRARATALTLIQRGYASLIASDAHDTGDRSSDFRGSRAALAHTFGQAAADSLLAAADLAVRGEGPHPERYRRRLGRRFGHG